MSARHQFDCVVVGAGHAGGSRRRCPRIGARVALVTGNLDTIAKMSCNPAIGGVAKGQVVREIDALGGVMGRSCRRHWHPLSGARPGGKASGDVEPTQCDKPAYANWVKEYIEKLPNVFPVQGDVVDLLNDNGTDKQRVTGVLRDGRKLSAGATIVTTGTFLRGLLHQGEAQTAGGRMGDGPGLGLSESFRRLGLRLGRMKTGTPMRIHADSVDWSVCEQQPGDSKPVPLHLKAMPSRWLITSTAGYATPLQNRINTSSTTWTVHPCTTDKLTPLVHVTVQALKIRSCAFLTVIDINYSSSQRRAHEGNLR